MPNKNLKRFIASILTLSMIAVEFDFIASAHNQVAVVNNTTSAVLPSVPLTTSKNVTTSLKKLKSDIGLSEIKDFNCGKPQTPGEEPTDKIKATIDSNTKELTIVGEGEMYDFSSFTGNFPGWFDEKYTPLINSIVIGEGVTSIGNFAFSDLTSLNEVTLSKSINSIGDSAFKGCENLVEVNFAQNGKLKTIGPSAFEETGVEDISIPDSVTLIDNSAFASCKNLYCLLIGSNVNKVGRGAFKFSNFLNSIIFKGNIAPSYDKQPFTPSVSFDRVYVPNDYNSDKFCGLKVQKVPKAKVVTDFKFCYKGKPIGLLGLWERICLYFFSPIGVVLGFIGSWLGIKLSRHSLKEIEANQAHDNSKNDALDSTPLLL